jgi:uncharacterized protein (TIGR03435 family)
MAMLALLAGAAGAAAQAPDAAAPANVRSAVEYAYRIRPYQLIGAPDWMSTMPFDITSASAGSSIRSEDEQRAALRARLADRFGLVARRDTRELPVFNLVVSRTDRTLGPQLVRSDTDCAQEPARFSSSGPVCMMLATRSFINGDSRTMPQLAAQLETYVNAPVVDRTRLEGGFNMTVEWASDAAMFAALQQQLGLTLEAARGAVDVIVVDSVRRPAEN